MANIRPNQLPPATDITNNDLLIIDQGAAGVNAATPKSLIDTFAPIATQSEAEEGQDNEKRMTPLRAHQHLLAQGVPNTRAVIAGDGLTGGGTLESDLTVALSSDSIASLELADSAVQSVNGKTGESISLTKGDVGLGNVDNTSDASKPISTATQTALGNKANSSVNIAAGTGLTGGGDLTANRNIALNAASVASLGKADTALQAPGGAAGQILAKSSNADNDVDWVTSEAATAVSYGPQELTEAQQSQARKNIATDIFFNNKAELEGAEVSGNVQALRLNGYSNPGDGGAALYKRVGSNPNVGPELQTNGNFASDTGWVKVNSAVIANGRCTFSGTSATIAQTIAGMSGGKLYRVQYRIVDSFASDGGVSAQTVGGSDSSSSGAINRHPGIYVDYIEAKSTHTSIRFYSFNAGGGSIGDVTVQEVTAGQVKSADGAWWELAEKNISTTSIGGNLVNWLAAAGTKPAVVDEGTWSLPSLLNLSDLKNRLLRGVNRLTSVIKRGPALTSAMSFNRADGISLSDFTLDMGFSATGNSGHGIIFLDSHDAEAKNVVVSDLGNNGGTAGSGIISYSSGNVVPIRNKVIDCVVTGNVALSDNTNGILLTDVRFSQMRGNFASGIAAFAHEYKNDARYNTGSDLIAHNSGYGLGFGQTTDGVDGVDYTAINNVIASACDVGFVLGEGAYNAINNLIVNTDGSPNIIPGGKYAVRISGDAAGNVISNVVSVGSATDGAVRIDSSKRNVVSVAIHDGSGMGSITFTGNSAANFVEVLHAGIHSSVEDKINDSTGNLINGGNANVVYSPTTGERLGSRSGYFKDSLVRGQTNNYASDQRWRFQSPDSVIFTGGLPATGGGLFGIQLNLGTTGRVAGMIYSVPLARWTMSVDETTIGRFDKQVWSPVSDNTIALGAGATRFSTIYAGTGTINTSDARAKAWRGDLQEAELNVAKRLSKLVGIYRWKDMIALKGDDARLHAGVKAQAVIAAFEDEGLDPFRYGVVCYDEWQEIPEVKTSVLDEDGNETGEFEITQPYQAAGNRYGVRYDEFWAFVAAGFEARLSEIEDKIQG